MRPLQKNIKRFEKTCLVEFMLQTGRTHQIRVSFKSINHPLANDPLYDEEATNERMYLKAYYLSFMHPITKKRIIVTI